jgi:hypothetical protein
VALLGPGHAAGATYLLPLAAAREAVRNRETVEAAALHRKQKSGVRFRYRPGLAEDDCGACKFCRDRPSNGGAGTLRQACEMQARQRLATLIDDIFPEAPLPGDSRPWKRAAPPAVSARPRKRRKRLVSGDVNDDEDDNVADVAEDDAAEDTGSAAAAGASTFCAICHDDDGVDMASLSCGHSFHADCLDNLVRINKVAAQTRRTASARCPLCRRNTRLCGATVSHAVLEA